jgi:hypothetical protein
VGDWVRALNAATREARGFGYELEREEVRSRVHGANTLPVAAIVPTEADALRLIRQAAAADRFQALASETLRRYPALHDWLARYPLTVLEHAAHWGEVLAVLDWFTAHPRPGLYLRQLDIPGVDTKFIETHRALLSELLDLVLPEAAVDRTAVGARAFNERYGLRSERRLSASACSTQPSTCRDSRISRSRQSNSPLSGCRYGACSSPRIAPTGWRFRIAPAAWSSSDSATAWSGLPRSAGSAA